MNANDLVQRKPACGVMLLSAQLSCTLTFASKLHSVFSRHPILQIRP
jgi:hypothetical protein